jgi:hypothetical protein
MPNLDACATDDADSECISLLFPSISVAAQVAINV